MDYKITKGSIEAAKRVFGELADTHSKWIERAFSAALDALCVPVEEESTGWRPDKKCSGFRFTKGQYVLRRHSSCWALYCDQGLCQIGQHNYALLPIGEAQAWADAEIAKHEAELKPKLIGPGSKFRLPNGAKVMITEGPRIGSYNVINLLNGVIMFFYWEDTTNKVIHKLKDLGAVEVP